MLLLLPWEQPWAWLVPVDESHYTFSQHHQIFAGSPVQLEQAYHHHLPDAHIYTDRLFDMSLDRSKYTVAFSFAHGVPTFPSFLFHYPCPPS